MKKHFILILLFLLTACSSPEPGFHDNEGHVIKFSDLKGKWVVINYWAKWCHACLGEIPDLNQFSHQYSRSVVVLGVSYDDLTSQQANQQAEALSIDYPLLVDKPDQYLKLKTISVVPTTIIIDPQGHVVARLPGPQTVASLKQAMHLS